MNLSLRKNYDFEHSIMVKSLILIALTILMFLQVSCSNDQPEFLKLKDPAIDRVQLLEGPWYDAMERDREYMKSLDPDRFLHHFRKVAGIETNATEYGGWESESRELRGHSIGHYLSAAARMTLLTGDTTLLRNCKYIVQELERCQSANGNGYLSAFPEEYLARVETIKPVWAPYYTLHKILAGLYDCYVMLGDESAKNTAIELSHYLYSRINPLGKKHFQEVLNKTEQGGMNELFWNLYSTTGDTICRALAYDFYEESYFDPMLARQDSLKGQHSNSLIPNVIGIAREYEVTGDITRRQMSEWFWNQVVGSRSFVTGGTSNGEHWNTPPWHMDTELGAEAHETCCTYNMIKLTQHLWGWDSQVKYQDYMERALVNGILPTQNTVTGMSMYYVSMAPGYYKTWGTEENSFWCCTGTGMENFARIAEYVYAVKDDRLFVNQFVSSILSYPEDGLKIIQQTDLPLGDQVSLRFECSKKTALKLAVRIPSWSGNDYTARINGRELETRSGAGSYLIIDRVWKDKDLLEIVFKPSLWYSFLPVKNNYLSLGYGPLVLAAVFGEAAVNDSLIHRYGPYDGTPVEVPAVVFNTDSINEWVSTTDTGRRFFNIKSTAGKGIDLIPFMSVQKEYYSVYLPVDSLY